MTLHTFRGDELHTVEVRLKRAAMDTSVLAEVAAA